MLAGKHIYACLSCGAVEEINLVRQREDKDKSQCRGHTFTKFHGFIKFHKCSECGHMQIIGREED